MLKIFTSLKWTAIIGFLGLLLVSQLSIANKLNRHMNNDSAANHLDTATLGAGCFWCVEAVYLELKGVKSVTSGYMGGKTANPTYKEICTGTTGHAEVCQIVFDPEVISYSQILEAFWLSHDPTTLNRQGNDIGTQYRSVIFYHNETQRFLAKKFKDELDKSNAYQDWVTTEISPLSIFYKAEDYHQNYYNQNGKQPYCSYVIKPKLEKFRQAFKEHLK